MLLLLSSILSNGGVSLFWNMVLLPIFGLSVISFWNLAIAFCVLFKLCLVIIERASFWQGCHKGRFWRKITVRTSFSSGHLRLPRGRVLTVRRRGKNRVRADTTKRPRGHERVCADAKKNKNKK
jgi:hypothetical protein